MDPLKTRPVSLRPSAQASSAQPSKVPVGQPTGSTVAKKSVEPWVAADLATEVNVAKKRQGWGAAATHDAERVHTSVVEAENARAQHDRDRSLLDVLAVATQGLGLMPERANRAVGEMVADDTRVRTLKKQELELRTTAAIEYGSSNDVLRHVERSLRRLVPTEYRAFQQAHPKASLDDLAKFIETLTAKK